MPAYNASTNIEEAINTVMNQTYKNWELIIINDCSKDDTWDIITRISNNESRIVLINLEENMGVARARNNGIKIAKGKYLAFLDSDDGWFETKLEKQVALLETTDEYFCVSSYVVIDETGNSKNKIFVPKDRISWKSQLKGSNIGLLTVLIDIEKTGKFEMPNKGHEDYITWSNLLEKNGSAISIHEPLAYYREGNVSVSSNKFKTAKWQYDIYREDFKLSVLKSLYYFLLYAINGVFKYKRYED